MNNNYVDKAFMMVSDIVSNDFGPGADIEIVYVSPTSEYDIKEDTYYVTFMDKTHSDTIYEVSYNVNDDKFFINTFVNSDNYTIEPVVVSGSSYVI